MLNIEILKLENDQAEVKVWIPKRNSINEPICRYKINHIKNLIDDKLKQGNKDLLSCEYLTEVSKLMNHLSDHKTEQIIIVKLIKIKPKSLSPTPKPKPKSLSPTPKPKPKSLSPTPKPKSKRNKKSKS